MSANTTLHYVRAAADHADCIAVLSLNRPAAANAFNGDILRELTEHLAAVATATDCRALVLRGQGRHFSAGADLAWMQAAAALSYDENLADAGKLTALFEALANLAIPTLAIVQGSAFGGAVGLTACCDVAIAGDDARFCLSEIKLGLMPAVILPYLARKMRPGALRRFGLSGRIFSAAEACSYGLVERVVPATELGAAAREELNGFLQGARTAQAAFKSLLQQVGNASLRQGAFTAEAIAATRIEAEAQAGLAAFFRKASAPWSLTLAPDFSLDSPKTPESK